MACGTRRFGGPLHTRIAGMALMGTASKVRRTMLISACIGAARCGAGKHQEPR